MATESANTLRSKAKYKIVDIVSEGDIKGLVDGWNSVYFDDTPVTTPKSDGTFYNNFDNSAVYHLKETSAFNDGVPVGDFPESEVTTVLNKLITKWNPEGETDVGDGSHTFTITDSYADAVRVTMRVPALTYTNPSNGDIKWTNASSLGVKKGTKDDGWNDFSKNEASPSYSSGLKFGVRVDRVDASTPNYCSWSAKIAIQLSPDNGQTWTHTFSRDVYYGKCDGWIRNADLYGGAGKYISYRQSGGGATVVDFEFTEAQSLQGSYKVRTGWINSNGQFQTSFTYIRKDGNNLTGTPVLNVTSSKFFYKTTYKLEGKCVSAYDRDIVIPLPKGGSPWQVRVSRTSDDHTSSYYNDKLYLYSYTSIVNNKFYYPCLDGFYLDLDAQDFTGNVPKRSYDIYGLKIKIPSNYNPDTREYNGVWNGTFKVDWTDNPAWILYDLITNKRYGLGEKIDASQVDKWAFYAIAQYCDESVPGYGGIGSEPRYTCNCCINSQADALELIQTMASTFRGMAFWSSGSITPISDKPTPPVINVGCANVIDGRFTYSSPAINTIHTVAYVKWSDPENKYKSAVEVYEDLEAIEKYGYNVANVTAFGCTSKGLARRLGAWAVKSEVDVPDTVTYEAGFDHGFVRPGDIINVSDPSYTFEELLGRLVKVTAEAGSRMTVKLDRKVKIVAGDQSAISFILPDGTMAEADCSSNTTTETDTLNVSVSAFSRLPVSGSIWMLKKQSVQPRQWRVISVSESKKNTYKVTATLFNPNKNAEIERGETFPPVSYTALPTSGSLMLPSNLFIKEYLSQTGTAISTNITFSWSIPLDLRVMYYEAQYQKIGAQNVWKKCQPEKTTSPSVDIIGVEPGVYNFRVKAMDAKGQIVSDYAYLRDVPIYGKQLPPSSVSDFMAVPKISSVDLTWTEIDDIDCAGYEIRANGSSWDDAEFSTRVNGNSYSFTDYDEGGVINFFIRAVDTTGNYSQNTATVSCNAVAPLAFGEPYAIITIEEINKLFGIEEQE
ncbi:unnamed protein product [Cylicocyclus nassatus]|uniref:Fibronectin type-III domain-containing protein n=1 Tax=Cylicocyclus nassatus TaxID=53992 RepID=A0AA36MIW3_CYLNA|nr:unnamed protein product [Cylicocyclus nassatus]